MGRPRPALPPAVSVPSGRSGSSFFPRLWSTRPSRVGRGPELASQPGVASPRSSGGKTIRRIMLRDVKTVRGSHGRGGDRRDAAPACCASAGHTAREAPRRPAPKPAPWGLARWGARAQGTQESLVSQVPALGTSQGHFEYLSIGRKIFNDHILFRSVLEIKII